MAISTFTIGSTLDSQTFIDRAQLVIEGIIRYKPNNYSDLPGVFRCRMWIREKIKTGISPNFLGVYMLKR